MSGRVETIALIDSGSGNLRSAAKALERAAAEQGLAIQVATTADPDIVRGADRIVLPGQGAFADCRRGLRAVPGLEDSVREAVIDRGRPLLGICVGMQILATVGHEHGDHPGLGWIPGAVVAIPPGQDAGGHPLKIPHMGWNELNILAPHPVLAGLAQGEHMYFVHSYHMTGLDPAHMLADVQYGTALTAIIGRDTMIATQFHVEKSQQAGLRLLGNFLRWRP